MHHAISSGWRIGGLSFIFQQDNDPKSQLYTNYFEKIKYAQVIMI